MNNVQLFRGDCLAVLPTLGAGGVELVLCDPPYGTTACKWDAVIPFEPMWREIRRVLAQNGSAIFTASQPFSSLLGASNIAELKYSLVWQKNRTGGFWDAKFRPLKSHEDVLVFSAGGCANGSRMPMIYNPQDLEPGKGKWTNKPVSGNSRTGSSRSGARDASNYPRSVLSFDSVAKPVHPTEKPVDLFEYLIRTYSNANGVVLDFTMGSGSTGVAAVRANRRFIGIERDPGYFKIAEERIRTAEMSLSSVNEGVFG